MKTVGSVEIDLPIEETYRLTTQDVTKWSTIVTEDEVIEDINSGGIGTRFRTVTEDRGQKMEFLGTVTAADPPKLHSINMTGDYFNLDVEYAFEEINGKTKVTQTSNVAGKGMTRVIFFLFGWLMKSSSCKSLAEELNGLKVYCESQAVPR